MKNPFEQPPQTKIGEKPGGEGEEKKQEKEPLEEQKREEVETEGEKDTEKRAEMRGLSKEEYKTLKELGEELANAHMGREARPEEEILRDAGRYFIDLFERQSSQKEQKRTEQISEEKGKEKIKSSEQSEQEAMFEFKKRLGEYKVSVGIEKGQEPIKSKIDLTKKEMEFQVTPEGIKKGIDAIQKFLNKPEVLEKLNKWTEWFKEKSDKLKEKHARETIKGYAEQEGKDEAEIIQELLDEIKKQELLDKIKKEESEQEK